MMRITGAIVVVAKCPIPGKSKTRLQPLLGIDGSALFAKAMLSDVLVTIHENFTKDGSTTMTTKSKTNNSCILKILLYAPGDQDGYRGMKEVLESLYLREIQTHPHLSSMNGEDDDVVIVDKKDNFDDGWLLLPMLSSNDLLSSDLGAKLMDAMKRVRSIIVESNKHISNNRVKEEEIITTTPEAASIVFLGMDSPELPLEEIQHGLYLSLSSSQTTSTPTAMLCPSEDGGYGMLCVPSNTPNDIFKNVQWSHPLTALSQIKAMTDLNVKVKLGRLMYDIDEPQDVLHLIHRLCDCKNRSTAEEHSPSDNTHKNTVTAASSTSNDNDSKTTTVLLQSSGTCIQSQDEGENHQHQQQRTGKCKYTWDALTKLGLIKQNIDNGTGQWVYCDSISNREYISF